LGPESGLWRQGPFRFCRFGDISLVQVSLLTGAGYLNFGFLVDKIWRQNYNQSLYFAASSCLIPEFSIQADTGFI
jgi:hypothetical protein